MALFEKNGNNHSNLSFVYCQTESRIGWSQMLTQMIVFFFQ